MAALSSTQQSAMTAARAGGGLRYLRGGFWVRADSALAYDAWEKHMAYPSQYPKPTEPHWGTNTVRALVRAGHLRDARTAGRQFMDRAEVA